MPYSYLEIRDCRRFDNSDLYHFSYEPSSDTQVIIGSNGSGKSSLMRLLTHLPQNKKEFGPKGLHIYKSIYNNNRYETSVRYDSRSPIYSFKKNGEELNKSKKVKYQLTLCEKEFGMTPKLHSMLIGDIKFTTMSSVERRNWFTSLSDSDYDYLIGVFVRVLERQKFLKNVIKHEGQNLIKEKEKEYQEKDIADLEKKIKLLENELDDINGLIYHYYAEDSGSVDITGLQDIIQKDLKRYRGKNNKTSIKLKNMSVRPGDLRSILLDKEKTLSASEARSKELMLQLRNLQDRVKKYDKKDLPDKKDLVRRKAFLDKEIQGRTCGYTAMSVREMLVKMNHLASSVSGVIDQLEENEDRRYSRKNIERHTNRLQGLRNDFMCLSEQKEEVSNRNMELRHLKTHDEVTCPKCKHKWYTVYDSEEHVRVVKELAAIDDKIKDNESKVDKTGKYLEAAKHYFSVYSQIKVMFNDSDLAELWDTISDVILSNPTSVPAIISEHIVKWEGFLSLSTLIEERSDLVEKIAFLESVTVDNADSLERLCSAHEVKYREELTKAEVLSEEIIELRGILKDIEDVRSMSDSLKKSLDKHILRCKLLTSSVKRKAMETSARMVKREIVECNMRLSEAKVQKALIDKIKLTLEQKNKELDIVKLLIKSLSPQTGLIGEILLGFMQVFLSNVNEHIDSFWSYSLEISIPEFDEMSGFSYDYKLPMVSKNHKFDDISKGSMGMKDVIDLSFRIAVMDKLGMDEYPLFLDEFGTSFDAAHRVKTYNFIRNIIAKQSTRPVFIVSHYAEVYNLFSDGETEYTVLCKDNVDLTGLSAHDTNTTLTLK